MTKPVVWVSDKARLKPVPSATESSKKIGISLLASLDMILSKKANNKGADQTAQAGLCLGCLQTLKTGFLVWRPILSYTNNPMNIFYH